MIEERLAGNFGDLHAYNFLTKEFSVSPTEATLSTTHVSEAVMMVPRLVTRRIPYWSGGSGSAFTARTRRRAQPSRSRRRWRWRQNFRCVGGNMHFTGTQPVMPRRDGRPWRERDNGGSRGFAHRNKGRLAGCRDRRFQTSDMGERDTLHEISEHVSRCFPASFPTEGDCCRRPAQREVWASSHWSKWPW